MDIKNIKDTKALSDTARHQRVMELQEELNQLKNDCSHTKVIPSWCVEEDGYCSACNSVLYYYFT